MFILILKINRRGVYLFDNIALCIYDKQVLGNKQIKLNFQKLIFLTLI